jgi:hypothetical protein
MSIIFHKIKYSILIKGDPKSANGHTYTLTDVGTKPVISLSGEADIEVAV